MKQLEGCLLYPTRMGALVPVCRRSQVCPQLPRTYNVVHSPRLTLRLPRCPARASIPKHPSSSPPRDCLHGEVSNDARRRSLGGVRLGFPLVSFPLLLPGKEPPRLFPLPLPLPSPSPFPSPLKVAGSWAAAGSFCLWPAFWAFVDETLDVPLVGASVSKFPAMERTESRLRDRSRPSWCRWPRSTLLIPSIAPSRGA